MHNHRLDEQAAGVYVIAATPFGADGALDYDSADRLVEFYLQEGVHGMTVLGVMGEAPKLSDTEQTQFMSHMLKRVDGRVPVIVGVSNPGVDNLVLLAQRAMEGGAAGVMVAGIAGLKTDEQAYAYFSAVIDRLGPQIPVCLQDYPPTTTVHLSIGVIQKMIDDFPSLVMFKHEDCPGMRKLTTLRRAPDRGHRRVSILTGNGGLYVPQELARGADGVMTGFAFPGMLVEVYERFKAGDSAAAEDLYDLYLPLIRHEQQLGAGLAIRKEVFRARGILSTGAVRQPGPSLDNDDRAELDHLISRLKSKLDLAGVDMPSGL